MLSVPTNFERQIHPKSVAEAATFFDQHFPTWFSFIELKTFDIFPGHQCVFGQVFGDYRFELYRKVFREEDEGLGDKQPKNPGIFWKGQYKQQWIGEIRKRQDDARKAQQKLKAQESKEEGK